MLKVREDFIEVLLDNVDMGDEGAEAFTAALISGKHKFVQLQLAHNNISVNGAKAVAALILANTTLTELHLEDNKIGNEGVIELVKCLVPNQTITSIYLSKNPFTFDAQKELTRLLMVNKTITYFDIGTHILDKHSISAIRLLYDSGFIKTS